MEYEQFYIIKEEYSQKEKQETSLKNEDVVFELSSGGSIIASPFLYKDTIFFGSLDQYFYALDLNGKVKWKFRTGDLNMMGCSVQNDIVCFGSFDSYVYALSIEGKLLWQFKTGGKVMCAPSIVDGIVYIGSTDSYLYALSLETGKELWKFLSGGHIICTPSVANSKIFFGSYDEHFYCLSTNGSLLWKIKTGGKIRATTPLIIDKNNNTLMSSNNRSKDSVPTGEDIKIIFGSWDSFIYCLDESGKIEWKFLTGGPISSSCPELYENNIYFGSRDGYMYKTDIKGKLIWKFRTGDMLGSGPFYHENKIYFGSHDNNLYCLSKNGRMLWNHLTGGYVVSSPLVYKDIIYFGSWDCHFYAVDSKTKKVLWKFQTLGFPSPLPYRNVQNTDKRRFRPESKEETKETKYGSLIDVSEVFDNKYASKNQYKSASIYKN